MHPTLTAAKAVLRQDLVMRQLVDTLPVSDRYQPGQQPDVYLKLLRSVIGQQISTAAAGAIWRRMIDLFDSGYPIPEELLDIDDDAFRMAGLSRAKIKYVRNVAEYFTQPEHARLDWTELETDDILTRLTAIVGVGKWTVQMILIFALSRPDVFPYDDLVIRNQIIKLYDVTEAGRELRPRVHEIAEAWRPYRSIACLYLWDWYRYEKGVQAREGSIGRH